VNSINWARVAAQIVYYFKGYFEATASNTEQVAFTVPSGNFGNICAGHIARQMGLPIRRLMLATNENNVLDEFFRTGIYRVRPAEQVVKTSSPSMDISKASNFERFIYDLVGRDAAMVRELWRKVDAGGSFDLSALPCWTVAPQFGFVTGKSTHADRLATIKQRLRKIQPHDRSAYRRRRERGTAIPRAGRAAPLPRDRAAGQVRRNDPRGAGSRPRDASRSSKGSRTGRSACKSWTRTRKL